jgi:hypothetical protein
MTATHRPRWPLPRLRQNPGLGSWAPYAVAVTLLSAGLGDYGIDPGSTPSLVLMVWFLLLAGAGDAPWEASKPPRAGGRALLAWLPSLTAGLTGFAVVLEPLQPRPFARRNMLLALLSAALAWALAPRSSWGGGRRGRS